MRVFNFVNFENLPHMKLYSLLILNKIQKHRKKSNFKAGGTKLWSNAVLAFNHVLGELTVCLGFVRTLINIVKKCF